ncbi:MAG: hypothetical protein ABSG43_17520 [Solirubrobacteraceae bacterium]|jgi:hypothetical protein
MIKAGAEITTTHIELWQTEWCPASHRVRQRLTELGLSLLARPVPGGARGAHRARGRHRRAEHPGADRRREIFAGEQPILTYLDTHYAEPAGAVEQRAKAAKAKHEDWSKHVPS